MLLAGMPSGWGAGASHRCGRRPRRAVAAWRNATACNAPTDLVFPSPDGSPWNADRARNWRKHRFREAATAAGVQDTRPYDLRHGFVSLLIAQGATVVEVARQAGHAPTMTLGTYAHLFDEFDGAERRSAEDLIREARNHFMSPEVRFVSAPPPRAEPSDTKSLEIRGARRGTRTPNPFITSEVLYQLS